MSIFNSARFKTALITIFSATLIVALGWYFYSADYKLNDQNIIVSKIEKIIEPTNSYIVDNKIIPSPLQVKFSTASANLQMLNTPLTQGITLEPALRGKWQWTSDTLLQFTPDDNWIPDTKYKVKLAFEIFNPNLKIKDKSFKFSAPVFSGKVINQEFYENPQNTADKSAIASFKFNYPLNPSELKNKILVKSINGEKYEFSYKLSDLDTVLHIISAPLTIQKQENIIKITVSDVNNIYNSKPLAEKIEATVKVPDSASFFKITSIKSSIIRNEQDNDKPQQILFIDFSTAVTPNEVSKNTALYYNKQSCSEIYRKLATPNSAPNILADSAQLELTNANHAVTASKKHTLQYDTTKTSGCLLVIVSDKITSAEGYNMGQSIIQPLNIATYPLEAKIAFDGSVLSRQGNKQVTFLSRGVNELHISTARINSSDINHLATQTGGDFSDPYFRGYYFTADNISQTFEKKLPINNVHPAEASYSSLDLNEYFQNKKGIFLIKVQGYANNTSSPEDTRLIVITDLGIVVKDNLDKTHNIFVSDITKNEPVAGALVEVLGKNGLPILSAETNQQGMAVIPDFSGFHKDKTAVAYKVSFGEDISFLPIDRADRRLDMSRFDVGGDYINTENSQALKGYIFSDRGIYRPSETADFGIIIRQSDLKVPNSLPFMIEVRNPNGDITATQNLKSDAHGFMTYQYTVSPTAPVGQYTISLYVSEKNNKRFISDTSFKVAEFTPDNMRIKAKWAGETPKGWRNTQELTADINLQNLYGNPATEHELLASYNLTPTDFRFEQYTGYLFRDPLRNDNKTPRTYSEELPSQKTDNEGNGAFTINLSAFDKGAYMLNLAVRGLEMGSGRGVSANLKTLFSPNKYLVGWKAESNLDFLHKNAIQHISYIAVNNNLEQINLPNLKLVLAKQNYVSSLVEMPNGTYRYQMMPKEEIIASAPFAINEQGTIMELQTAQAGEFVLKVEDQNGNLLASSKYTVAGSANLSHSIDKEASLGLKLNRKQYHSGDIIEMQITAPYTGYGLITIERDNVYAYKWFKADTTSVNQSITLPQNIEGNAYVNVAFFRDIHSSEIYMPAMSYAIAPFAVNIDKRRLDVVLDTPKTVKSGDKLAINYHTSENAKIIIFGVNEGILQVARYQTPNPLAEFMKKRALRVQTSQIMDLIMPDINIMRMLSSSGGDTDYSAEALSKNLNPFARRNSKPVVFWSGIIDSSAQTNTYYYNVPETFNGEIKIMAVAVSADKFGSANESVLARGDFALIPSGPLSVAPNDEFVIGLSIGNLVDGSGNNYPLKASITTHNGFEIIGDTTHNISINENAEALVKFRLKALPDLGDKELMFMVESINDNTKKSHMPYTVNIRPLTPYSSNFDFGFAQSEFTLKHNEIENLYSEFRTQQAMASASPFVLVSGLMQYLNDFPHWCTEQSISKIFPAIEVFFKHPELVKNIDIYELYGNIISVLHERQTLNGGFSNWSDTTHANKYDSIYGLHFLTVAKQRGFNVPDNMLNRAISYAETIAERNPTSAFDYLSAYAIYTLTLNGKVTTNYLLQLEQYYKDNNIKNWQETLPASFMAASYQMLQDQAKARSLAGIYKNKESQATENAINLYLLATHFPDMVPSLAKNEIETLLQPLNDGNYTTKSSSWSILALNAIPYPDDDENIKFSTPTVALRPFPTADFSNQVESFDISSTTPFYYMINQSGFIKGEIVSRAKGLEVFKTYHDSTGAQVNTAKIGEELTVKIKYRGLTVDPIYDVALVDLLAGCFEIVNGSVTSSRYLNSSEIREDRFIAHVTAYNDVSEISYKVKVIAEGSFITPPVFGSALYQPLVRANSSTGLINVSN